MTPTKRILLVVVGGVGLVGVLFLGYLFTRKATP